MVKIFSADDVKNALKDLGPVVGLGVNAFPRTGIIGLVSDYQIVCIQDSSDLEAIKRKVSLKSVKGDFGGKVEKLNTLSLLKHNRVQEYLGSLARGTHVFVYRSSRQIEAIVDQLGLDLLSNRSGVRDVFENKWEFRRLGARVGLPLIAGEQMLIDDFDEDVFRRMQQKLGKRLVFQITDYSKGGGIGTFFVSDIEKFREFHGFVQRRRAAGRNLRRVNVTRFIEGESASINVCVTRHGILTSRVQRQIVDVREVVGYYGRSGVFCGHDWGERYSERIQRRAQKLVKNLGELMYKNGYRGIFGIDLVANRETDDVQMVECNSRYTGAFPVYTMLQKKAGEIPVDAWHLLEFAGVEYDMDFAAVQRSYEQVKTGAQLILHNLERAWVAVRGDVKAGVYRINKPSAISHQSSLEWVRDGFSLEDIQGEDEFVFTDGVPYKNVRLKPGARIGRVIFRRTVMEDEGNQLQPEVKRAMKEFYKMYRLQKIKRDKD